MPKITGIGPGLYGKSVLYLLFSLYTGLYSPDLSKCYFLQIHTKICSKVPIFYFNGPKRPPDNCYVTCLLREESALHVTRFFPSPKTRVRRGPSVGNKFWQEQVSNHLPKPEKTILQLSGPLVFLWPPWSCLVSKSMNVLYISHKNVDE